MPPAAGLARVRGAAILRRCGWVAQLVEQRTENPRVASSILAPAIVNQRLTRFWVVTNRTTFVLHEGGPAMVPPLTFVGWGRCSTRFTTDTVGNPSVDHGVGWYLLDGTEMDLCTT